MAPRETTPPRWPLRIAALSLELRSERRDDADSPEGRSPSDPCRRAELWVLLRGALCRYLDLHAGRAGRPAREDLEDLASAKALELLTQIESGKWGLEGRSGAEIAGFLSAVARNGLSNLRRRSRREVLTGEIALEEEAAANPNPVPPAAARAEAKQFAQALIECAEHLGTRARHAWFLRVFYDLPSKRIAAHPAVALKPGHVDVVLQRSREAIRKCMTAKGHDPAEMPPGTFVELWRRFRASIGTELRVEMEPEFQDVPR